MHMRVAFHLMGGEKWTVGPIYLRNLFYALRYTYGKEVVSALLAPDGLNYTKDHLRSMESDDVIIYSTPRRWSPLWVINELIKRLLSCDMVIKGILKEHQINVVFGPTLVYKYPKIVTLSWIPDFQHIHLPELFSKEEILYRDRTFLKCARLATRLILMSNAARKDFESFAPMYMHKAKVLHPVTYVSESVYNYDLNSVLNLYHLPDKFVYLPNQFWKHKNHERAFQSIKILRERGIKVFVVCTGNPVDYRHPTYFASLFQKLSEWNIRNQIIYLGLIPHEHVLQLMRQSICVLNPSLFEGWGYTVDEARSVGKRVLLSDIRAHCEQDPPQAMFFEPHDCDDLAKKIGQIWEEMIPGPDGELESEARSTLPGRLCGYGKAFVSVAQDAIQKGTTEKK